MKRILIEWTQSDGKANLGRSRPEGEAIIANVVETMRPFLATMQIQLDVRLHELPISESGLSGTIRINGREAAACAGGNLSVETLTDAVLKESARFTEKGCAGSPEDLNR